MQSSLGFFHWSEQYTTCWQDLKIDKSYCFFSFLWMYFFLLTFILNYSSFISQCSAFVVKSGSRSISIHNIVFSQPISSHRHFKAHRRIGLIGSTSHIIPAANSAFLGMTRELWMKWTCLDGNQFCIDFIYINIRWRNSKSRVPPKTMRVLY